MSAKRRYFGFTASGRRSAAHLVVREATVGDVPDHADGDRGSSSGSTSSVTVPGFTVIQPHRNPGGAQ